MRRLRFCTFLKKKSEPGIRLLFPDIPVCVYCGKELPAGDICPECRRREHTLFLQEAVRFTGFSCKCVLQYDDMVRQLIHRYKFQGERWLSSYMAEKIYRHIAACDFDIVSFVPLYKRRERWRGFNQVRILAQPIAACFSKPCAPLLQRTRNTPPQSSLPREARIRNVRGAFSMLPGAEVRGKTVLFIDDVITAGATMGECVTVLRAAGARVRCAAFAAALPQEKV